jgi:hypothetical protein
LLKTVFLYYYCELLFSLFPEEITLREPERVLKLLEEFELKFPEELLLFAFLDFLFPTTSLHFLPNLFAVTGATKLSLIFLLSS